MSIRTFIQGKKMLVVIGVGLLATTGLAVALLTRSDETDLPKELSVEAIQAAAANPGEMRERIREAFQREDLTREQRTQVHHNIRQVMETQMDLRFDEYFTASPSERQAVLDRHLDELRTRIQEHQRAGRRGPNGEAGRGPGFGGRGPGAGGAGAGRGDGPPGGRRGFRDGSPTRQDRKERSESRDPDRRARMMAYFTAMRNRAEERGMELPFPRGGGPRGGR